jgi:hypothetical protein
MGCQLGSSGARASKARPGDDEWFPADIFWQAKTTDDGAETESRSGVNQSSQQSEADGWPADYV